MNILNSIEDQTIIICENNYKEIILKLMNQNCLFLNVKFYTKYEFLSEYFFKYDEKTIYYLINKYDIKVEIAKLYLKNLLYISKDFFNNPKLDFLVKIKKDLDANHLLIYNDNFKNIIKNKKIIIIGYAYLEPIESSIFNELNAKYIDEEEKYELNDIYEFAKREDEINYVCHSICELIKNGVPLNKIKISGIDKDYYNDLERIFKLYKIEINIPTANNLFSHNITKKFLNNINNSIEEGILAIKDDNEEIVNKIINICNKYFFSDNLNIILKLIINDLKNTEIDNYNYQNYIEIKDINSLFIDEYVFFMNFNNGKNPITIKDEDYFTDNIKDKLGLTNTNLINKYNREYLVKKLKSIKHLKMSYILNDQNGIIYPSSLIKELNLNIIKYDNNYTSYSYLNDLINYTKLLDNYELYGEVNPRLHIYHNTFAGIGYKTYDNNFKGINISSLYDYLNNHITLSYSSLINYNRCAFRYYLANILKLDKFEDSFETFIGSLFHDVLEKCFNNNLIVEEEINKYIKDKGKTLSIKERFFVEKIINDIKFVINVLNKQKKYINLDKAYYEKNIKIDKSREINIIFTGFIDKILYKERNDETLVAIIDYKTGNIDLELKYLPYGLSLQLPVYLYLVKKSNLFKKPKFVGFYLQNILDKNINKDNKLTYEEQRYNNLKLKGYSINEESILKEFDNSYQNSDLIKSMKLNNNGNFNNYAKVLNNNEINKIIDLTEKNVDEAIDKILKGDFNINPKRIEFTNNLGCLYCHFQDICFKEEKDIVNLEEISNLDFLEADNHAEVD